jgi:hypothetical protein
LEEINGHLGFNELKNCSWGELEGSKWISKGQGVKYLRVQIRFGLSWDTNFDNLLASLKTKLITCAFARLSFAQKACEATFYPSTFDSMK